VAAEALFWLAAARLLIILLPFRTLRRMLAEPMPVESPEFMADPVAVRRIAWALHAVARRVPWRCKCLERAIAGKFMLRVRGLPNSLYLGLARPDPDGPIQAHAWLRCGSLPVVGEEAPVDSFAVVAKFPETGRRSRPA
jgi:hypothetical protein